MSMCLYVNTRPHKLFSFYFYRVKIKIIIIIRAVNSGLTLVTPPARLKIIFLIHFDFQKIFRQKGAKFMKNKLI